MKPAFVALFVIACGTTTTEPGDSGPGGIDTGEPPIGSCGGPSVAAGTTSGTGLAPWALPDCDGNMYAFYGDDEGYCDSTYTVISIAAGWCAPCLEETAHIEERVQMHYASRGVRTVQVLLQDNMYSEPSASFCQSWVNRFDLTLPVLRDPAESFGPFTAGGTLPVTIIVDNEGVIQNVERGGTPDWSTTRAVLDSLLEE